MKTQILELTKSLVPEIIPLTSLMNVTYEDLDADFGMEDGYERFVNRLIYGQSKVFERAHGWEKYL